MKYFGIPKCPYCGKRVNIIRRWLLKKQGEYKCPRCGGISNIYLSPLIYVFGILAIFSSGVLYFFHKFVLEDIEPKTAIQVIIPFAIFFLLSLFMVYLSKPVIKKVPKTELDKKRGRTERISPQNRPAPAAGASRNIKTATGRSFSNEKFIPDTDKTHQPAGNSREMERPRPVPKTVSGTVPRAATAEMDKTAVIREAPAARPRPAGQQKAGVDKPQPIRKTTQPGIEKTEIKREVAVADIAERMAKKTEKQAAPQKAAGILDQKSSTGDVGNRQRPAAGNVQKTAPEPVVPEPVVKKRTISSVEIPEIGGDYFAKYDDPAYVDERLNQTKNEK